MVPIMMALALAGGQAAPVAAPVPSAEAEALGVKIAQNGALAIMLPQISRQEIDAMIAKHTDLSAADLDQLRAIAKHLLDDRTAQLMTLLGHQYALSLSIEDLRAIAAFDASPAWQRWRAAEPDAVMVAAKSLDGYDFEKQLADEFCKASGKLCAGTPK